MLYLYAIAAELGDVAELRGIQGEAVVRFSFRDALVVAGYVASVPTIDAHVLKAQDTLVRALHNRSAALLPMRFGMTIPDVAAIHAALAYERIEHKLQQVRGREQMTLRVIGPEKAEEPAPDKTTGTAYLLSRAKRRWPSEEMALISSGAASLVREVHVEPIHQHGVHGSVYHLIDRGRSDEYRQLIVGAAAQVPHMRVVITGPSPAYAFA